MWSETKYLQIYYLRLKSFLKQFRYYSAISELFNNFVIIRQLHLTVICLDPNKW